MNLASNDGDENPFSINVSGTATQMFALIEASVHHSRRRRECVRKLAKQPRLPPRDQDSSYRPKLDFSRHCACAEQRREHCHAANERNVRVLPFAKVATLSGHGTREDFVRPCSDWEGEPNQILRGEGPIFIPRQHAQIFKRSCSQIASENSSEEKD